MNKFLVLATTVFAIVGSSLAIAHQRFGYQDGSTFIQPNPEDLAAFADARVAAIKAGLQLTPDQAKNWPVFEQAYRNLAKLRSDRITAGRNNQASGDQSIADRLQRRADRISQYGAALQDLAKAEKPLYESLNDAQKHRFVMLTRIVRSGHRHLGMWQGRHFSMWQHGDRGQGSRGHEGQHFGDH